MVFSNLPDHEKDAFFSLLDEYFQSRPELAASLQSSGGADSASVVGRVAAAASTFENANNVPLPPRRTSTYSPPQGAKGLTTTQRIGNIDTSSKGGMLGSAFRKNPAASAPPIAPSAFPAKQKAFVPPPRREPVPEPEPEEEEAAGEWAEALYDYDSTDPGDLPIREKQRVLVTERTSADWWTGEVDGKSGLFPASYVKIL